MMGISPTRLWILLVMVLLGYVGEEILKAHTEKKVRRARALVEDRGIQARQKHQALMYLNSRIFCLPMGEACIKEPFSLAYLDLSPRGKDEPSAQLLGIRLPRAQMAGINLEKANLTRAVLIRSQLPRANLAGAILVGAKLDGANLRRAKLRGADLRRASLRGAVLKRADFSGANLQGTNITQAQLRSGCIQLGEPVQNLHASLQQPANCSNDTDPNGSTSVPH
ncbi:MAG: pentapeptide repeat-containing protein [Magnetococcales bacterium]|nr:pentapeptide repeat-containing protein [Magnetococcales bacterium]